MYFLLVGLIVLGFAGCASTDVVENDVPTTDDTVTTEPVAEVSYLTYTSDSLGLSFEYPATGVSITEDLDTDQDGEIGTVTLTADNGNTTNLSVEWIDSPTLTGNMAKHLWTLLLYSNPSCELTEESITTDKEIYGLALSDTGVVGDCDMFNDVYYFPAQVNKAVTISSGQEPSFSDSDVNQHFLDSIRLFQ